MSTNNAQNFIYLCVGCGKMYRMNTTYNEHKKKCKSTPFSESFVNRCIHRSIVLVYQPDIPIYTTETEHNSLIGVTVSEQVRNGHRFMKGWAVHPKKGTDMGRNTSSNYEEIIWECVMKGGKNDAANMSAAMILEYIQRVYPR